MPTLNVGPSRPLKTIAAAVAQAKSGDTIQIDTGEYIDDYPPVIRLSLAFVTNGGRVTWKCTKLIPNGKGIVIAGGSTGYPTISFDSIDFVGAQVTDKNGAAIRWQAGDCTLTNCSISHCQDGILATPFVKGTGTISIDRTEVAYCGAGDGQSHGLYIGYLARATVTNSFVHSTSVGHHIKTRAANTTISNCRLYDLDGNASYAVDCPNAGNITISNCSVQQSAKNSNPYMFTYGVGGASNPGRNAMLTSTQIVNDATSVKLVYNAVLDDSFLITDCSLFGVPNNIQSLGRGPVVLQAPTWLAARPPLDTTSHPYTTAGTEGMAANLAEGPPLPMDDDTDPETHDDED